MTLDNKFFIIFLFIIGIILLIIHFIIDYYSESCSNLHRITQINKGFLMIAIILVTAITVNYTMDCKSIKGIKIFLVFYIILGILIISLSSSSISSVEGDCDAVKNIFIVTLILGIIIVIASIIYLFYLYRFNIHGFFEGFRPQLKQTPFYSRVPRYQ